MATDALLALWWAAKPRPQSEDDKLLAQIEKLYQALPTMKSKDGWWPPGMNARLEAIAVLSRAFVARPGHAMTVVCPSVKSAKGQGK